MFVCSAAWRGVVGSGVKKRGGSYNGPRLGRCEQVHDSTVVLRFLCLQLFFLLFFLFLGMVCCLQGVAFTWGMAPGELLMPRRLLSPLTLNKLRRRVEI